MLQTPHHKTDIEKLDEKLEKQTIKLGEVISDVNLTVGEYTTKTEQELVKETNELVDKANVLLARRDGLFMTPKKLRKQRYEEFSDEYADIMMKAELNAKKLKKMQAGKLVTPDEL